jgi:predicted transcriptional regulator
LHSGERQALKGRGSEGKTPRGLEILRIMRRADTNANTNARADDLFSVFTRTVLDLCREKKLKRSDMHVINLLLSYADSHSTLVYRRQAELAANLGCSVDTLQRSLKRLVAVGLLAKIRLRTADGKFDQCVYDLAGSLALIPHHPQSNFQKEKRRAASK